MPIRDHRIDIRFTETEKDAIGRAARSKGYKSASAMIRDAVSSILRPGIDGMSDRRLASIELLLMRLNAKLQHLIFLRLGESPNAELSAIATEVAQLSTTLKTEVHKLRVRTYKIAFPGKRPVIQGSRREPMDDRSPFLADRRSVRAA